MAVFSAPAPGAPCLDSTVGGTESNTYIGSDDLVNYLRCRANDTDKLLSPLYAAVAESVPTAESLLLRSAVYVDQYASQFRGFKTDQEQSLEWPRGGVYVRDYLRPDDSIPDEIKVAQVYFAAYLHAGSDPFGEFPTVVDESTSSTDGPEIIDGTVTRAGTIAEESYLSGLYTIKYDQPSTSTQHTQRTVVATTASNRTLDYNDRSIAHYMQGAVDIMRPLIRRSFSARRA